MFLSRQDNMSASLIASRTAHFTAWARGCKGLLAQCGFRAVFFCFWPFSTQCKSVSIDEVTIHWRYFWSDYRLLIISAYCKSQCLPFDMQASPMLYLSLRLQYRFNVLYFIIKTSFDPVIRTISQNMTTHHLGLCQWVLSSVPSLCRSSTQDSLFFSFAPQIHNSFFCTYSLLCLVKK